MNNFDWKFYIFLYDDLKHINNEEDAVDHYITNGIKEKRIINKSLYDFFDHNFYVSNYPDIAHFKNKKDTFIHYITYGIKEERICNKDYKDFDWEFYIFLYDLENINTKIDAYKHYVTSINKENIIITKGIYDTFDWKFYVYYYNDLKNITNKKEAFLHYMNSGIHEKRLISKNDYDNFDWEFYIKLNNHLKNKEEAYNHYIQKRNAPKIEKIKCQSYITFIIPTIGRKTLLNTLNSLLNLKDSDWKAIILFDGITNEYGDLINDKRFYVIEIKEKKGSFDINGKAGFVRNIGIEYVSHTRWIGFVDDDDTLSPNYIDNLRLEDKVNNNLNVCVFRMIDSNNNITPPKNEFGIHKGSIGISFAIKNNIFRNITFKNDNYEDYYFLKECEFKNYAILISNYITYFVRSDPFDIDEVSKDINRVNINF
jgi:hypothetical protein